MTGPAQRREPDAPKPVSPVDGLMEMNVMADATVGYRRKLLDGGVPEERANQMTHEYHALLLETMRKSLERAKVT